MKSPVVFVSDTRNWRQHPSVSGAGAKTAVRSWAKAARPMRLPRPSGRNRPKRAERRKRPARRKYPDHRCVDARHQKLRRSSDHEQRKGRSAARFETVIRTIQRGSRSPRRRWSNTGRGEKLQTLAAVLGHARRKLEKAGWVNRSMSC